MYDKKFAAEHNLFGAPGLSVVTFSYGANDAMSTCSENNQGEWPLKD